MRRIEPKKNKEKTSNLIIKERKEKLKKIYKKMQESVNEAGRPIK